MRAPSRRSGSSSVGHELVVQVVVLEPCRNGNTANKSGSPCGPQGEVAADEEVLFLRLPSIPSIRTILNTHRDYGPRGHPLIPPPQSALTILRRRTAPAPASPVEIVFVPQLASSSLAPPRTTPRPPPSPQRSENRRTPPCASWTAQTPPRPPPASVDDGRAGAHGSSPQARLCLLPPRPIWPSSPLPKAQRSPARVTISVWLNPHATMDNGTPPNCRDPSLTGTSLSSRSPCPSCPWQFRPQSSRAPDSAT
jgi:hypothetical protein